MYAILAVSEALGSSNQSQVIDLFANSNNAYTPAYAIYERGTLARVALFNYMTDSSGANDYTVSISVGGTELGQPNGTPSQVKVKYVCFAFSCSCDLDTDGHVVTKIPSGIFRFGSLQYHLGWSGVYSPKPET